MCAPCTPKARHHNGAGRWPGVPGRARRPGQARAGAVFHAAENATLAGATAMTALIGRVPIDGRVTDPMQFKAVIGRDNLAANGFELPGMCPG